MKRMLISKALILTAALASLVGCSGPGSYYGDTGEGWGNFKCTAVNQVGSRSMGWAVSQSRASSVALAKCQARSANPASCRITQCISQ